MICKPIVLLSLCLTLSSCTNYKHNLNNCQINYSFIGDWQGDGSDSKGNSFNFYARVSPSGDDRYRLMILTDFEKINEPIHIMDGVLENNKFSYTADEGVYKGEGTLYKDLFEGYYKGPVDGTYRMRRIKSEMETK